MMDEKELKLIDGLIVEVQKKQNSRIKAPLSWKELEGLLRDAKDPRPAEDTFEPSYAPPPVIPPEFPRALVDYKAGEYIVMNNFAEWAPYHDWYTVFPPQQPASRPVTTTLEAEVEKLKAQSFKERPKEDWERRKQKGPSGLWWEGRSF